MPNVLLTGAGGFIGSHLAEALVRQGARLRAFVRYNSRGDPGLLRQLDPRVLAEIELVSGDLSDADAVRKAAAGCETVFHLGAIISIPYSYRHPQAVVTANVTGTLNVLLACRDLGVRRLVHTSTSEVYGTALSVPSRRSTRCRASRPTRLRRSPPTSWPRASTAPTACRWSPCGLSTLLARASRPAR
jgi:dTDP-glucose 4,6-dehydratase